MKRTRLVILIALSAFALAALLLFQTRWIKTAHKLEEAQFNNRVSMALCQAVNELSEDESSCLAIKQCVLSQSCQPWSLQNQNQSQLKQSLKKALSFYQLPQDFHFQLSPKSGEISPLFGSKDQPLLSGILGKPIHGCSLTPIKTAENWELQVIFPGKNDYLLKRMKFMLLSSLAVIILITLLVLYSIRTVWKQQQIATRNIEFFNNMAHEFKTPLTNISLATNLIQKEGKQSSIPFSTQLLSVIKSENQHLISQVEKILSLSRLEIDTLLDEKTTIDVEKIVQQATQSMALLIDSREGKIQTNIFPGLPPILGNPEMLQQAILNLLDNACKYSDGPPDIQITATQLIDSKFISIKINDNGIGIPSSKIPFIFDKYYRISHGNRHDVKGFGLGLAYVNKVIKLHNGSIQVSSQPTEGSSFEILLPHLT